MEKNTSLFIAILSLAISLYFASRGLNGSDYRRYEIISNNKFHTYLLDTKSGDMFIVTSENLRKIPVIKNRWEEAPIVE